MLTNKEDAYGQEIFTYWRSLTDQLVNPPFEIIERDDGWIGGSTNTPQAYFAEYEQWLETEKNAIASVTGRVLDIGCGAGRVGLYLQRLGYEVLGIDISPLALEVCRLRGFTNIRLLSITQLSSALGMFDTITMFGNNFGLFSNPKRAKHLLKRFYSITTPGGKILATSNDVYQTDDHDHLAYHRYNRSRGRMSGQIRLRVRYKNYKSQWFDYLMVSKEEMSMIINDTKWEIVKFFTQSESSVYTAQIEKRK